MKIKDLKKLIKNVDDELQVRLIADHGHTPMKLNCCGEGYITEDSYTPDEIHLDDLKEYGDDYLKVFILEAF